VPRFGPISRRDLIAGLRALGFDGPTAGGNHQVMIRGAMRLPIPNPHQDEIGPKLLARILREAGISRDEWETSQPVDPWIISVLYSPASSLGTLGHGKS